MSKKILITGASSEIGLAICSVFNKPENILFLQCFSNKEKLETYTKDFVAQIFIYQVDFYNEAETQLFLSELQDITCVINAAAYTKTDILVNLSEEEMHKMLVINSLIPARICKTVIPFMLVQRNGVIINISSIAAQRGNRGQTVYGGTKGFLESFTKSLAAEYGMKGIRVNCVAPGAIDAGSIKELLQIAPDEVKKSIALNRLGSTNDVASMVQFLCSDEASFISGQTIHVDGGFQRGV